MAENIIPVTTEEKNKFYSGGSKEIVKILDDLELRDKKIDDSKNFKSEKKRLEKELENTKKELEKKLKDDVEKSRNERVSGENQKIKEASQNMKVEKLKKGKAKFKGINERIERETKELNDNNRELHRKIRKNLKEKELPVFCDNSWFYVMYCPQGAKEWAIKILVLIIGIFVIPSLMVKMVGPCCHAKWNFIASVFNIFIYALVLAILAAVYLTIYITVKDKDLGTIEEQRESRDKIADNKKEIRKIKKSIRDDKDESEYNLQDYNEKIDNYQGTIEHLTKEKEAALADFDENTKPGMEEEIKNQYQPRIDEISKNLEDKINQENDNLKSLEELNNKISYDYGRFMPQQYFTVANVRKMLELVEGGNAANIGEALEKIR